MWAVFILLLTSVPNPNVPRVSGLDKVGHFAMYAVLALFAARASGPRPGAAFRLATIAGISALGAVDEWHQLWVPGRSTDPADWVADTIGACAGTLLAAAGRSRRELAS